MQSVRLTKEAVPNDTAPHAHDLISEHFLLRQLPRPIELAAGHFRAALAVDLSHAQHGTLGECADASILVHIALLSE